MVEFQNVLSAFDKISLNQMQNVKLMDREESKFLIKRNDLLLFLKDLPSDYFVFSIENKEVLAYHTEYYDTPDLDFYRAHLTGKSNRLKVRIRNYVDSKISFIELKKKNNKGRTLKIRQEYKGDFPEVCNETMSQFLKQNGFISDSSLVSTLKVFYQRITLVSKRLDERITIDLDLRFFNPDKEKTYQEGCIIEVKQLKRTHSPVFNYLQNIKHLKDPLSKYCLGLLSLRPLISHNLFKSKIYKFNKLINNSL